MSEIFLFGLYNVQSINKIYICMKGAIVYISLPLLIIIIIQEKAICLVEMMEIYLGNHGKVELLLKNVSHRPENNLQSSG